MNRPLSPHLSVYRWQLNMVVSILHRMTGVALVLGLFLLVGWLVSLAGGEDSFHQMQSYVESPLGWVVLFGLSFCLFYHLCHGIRHLLWDIGVGFTNSHIILGGWLVVLAALVLTLLIWLPTLVACLLP